MQTFSRLLKKVSASKNQLRTTALVIAIVCAWFVSGSAGAQTNCFFLPSGAVSWWPAEDSTADAVGANTASLLNGATYTNGLVGRAFSLNGTSAKVQAASSPSLRFTNAMTVEAWIYPRIVKGRTTAIIMKWDSGPGGNERAFSLFMVEEGWAALSLNSDGLDQGSVDIITVFSASVVPSNQWTHVCGTYDGATLKMYFNGVLESSAPWTKGIFPGSAPLLIGGAIVPSVYFSGLIDEPTLYNRALSATEVQAIFNAGAVGKCFALPPSITSQPASQVGYWGGSALFSVGLAPNPIPATYQWHYEGFPLPLATNASFTLTNLGLGEGGRYQVVISNLVGSVTSAPALLVINPAGVEFGLAPRLTLTGAVGKVLGIQYATQLNLSTVWINATNLTLSQPVQTWYDTSADANSGNHPRRYYRVVPLP